MAVWGAAIAVVIHNKEIIAARDMQEIFITGPFHVYGVIGLCINIP